jgi:hypothetical protein
MNGSGGACPHAFIISGFDNQGASYEKANANKTPINARKR